ncbi:hypothetical protein [Streptomyces sp. NPDC048106]|uniref:hypothetical protein n=1 Tax=Streptomyces sp. NPDC048106 TaxID=3155750 RepID=UPI003451DB47
MLNEQLAEIVSETKKKIEEVTGAAWDSAGSFLDKPAVAMHADPNASSINASSQALYYSQQLGKFDVSAVTTSFDAFKVDESGISFMGAKLYEFPWVSKIEEKFGTASASAKKVEDLEKRMATAEQTINGDARTAESRNREIYGYKEESERSFQRIKDIHGEAKTFAQDVERRTNAAKDELVRVIEAIDQAIGRS